MPHATMKLIPGIDTNKTPALNEAAFSASQLVRFVPDRNGMGLIQKMGGWQSWSTVQFPLATELHAWEDLASVQRLAVGDDAGVYYMPATSPNNATNITPQVVSGNSPLTGQTATFASSTITVALSPPNFAPVYFTTTGALPTGITAGTIYYVTNATATTFQIAATPTGSAITLSGTPSGTNTVYIQSVITSSGSSTVTITDVGTGVQTVTFASNIVTVGTTAGGGTGIVPSLGAQMTFYGASLPSGVTAGTTYYIVSPTTNTYQLSATLNGAVLSFGTGSGTQYQPNAFQIGYSVNFKTPVSVGGILLSGLYYITGLGGISPSLSSYFNTYTISAASAATASTYPSGTAIPVLPTFLLTPNSSNVTVTEPNNPYQNGYTATFLTPTTYGGVTISGSYIVSNWQTNGTYTIVTSTASTVSSPTTVPMNTGDIAFQYTFNIPSASTPGGYGTGGYGQNGYGIGAILTFPTAATITTNDWSIVNFGETLIINPLDGAIYYWSPSLNTQTAYLTNTAPQVNHGVFVAMPARQLVAYGSTATGIQDPLLVAWSDAGDFTTWIAASNNQAGSYRIPEGSRIVAALQGPQQALIWTDLAIWAMQYVGPPNVYGFNKIADGVGAISKKCVGVMEGVVYWMSPNKFMSLTGNGPTPVMCPIWDIIFQNINTNLYESIRCACNSTFGEVSWFYPSLTNYPVTGLTVGVSYTISAVGTTNFTLIGAANNNVGTTFTATAAGTGTGTVNVTENDSYVKYNIFTQQWDYGILDRLAWIDQSVLGPPIGVSANGTIYQHEIGYDAGTSPMISSFQTGYMQLNEADNLIFIDQIWPDFKWNIADGNLTPATLYITFYGTNYPGDTPIPYGPYTITQSTEYLSVRIRNRLLSFSVSTSPDGTNAASNIFYRIGAVRYRYQLDGRF